MQILEIEWKNRGWLLLRLIRCRLVGSNVKNLVETRGWVAESLETMLVVWKIKEEKCGKSVADW